MTTASNHLDIALLMLSARGLELDQLRIQKAKRRTAVDAPAIQYNKAWGHLRASLAALSLDDLAYGTFDGYVPNGYAASANRILYVCESVPGYIPVVFGKGPHPLKNDSAATDFARSLGELARGAGDPLDSIAVTAVCKAPLLHREISTLLLLAQQQLAVTTLRFEMYGLEPKLVVFACGGKFSAAIRETVNATRGSLADLQAEGQGNDKFLFRARGDAGEPAILSVQPPGAFPKSVQSLWLAKAAALLV